MNNKDREILSKVWLQQTGEHISPKILAERILFQGGVDFRRLTENDIVSLFHGEFRRNWDYVGFSFSELLAFYSGISQSGIAFNSEEAACWVFTVFVIADAIKEKSIDLELQMNSFLNSFYHIRESLHLWDVIHIFVRIFEK